MNLNLYLLAIVIRLSFILYGTLHDKLMEVKFTDIDYSVFTEAARYITEGQSPYLKTTYKYTPLLADILTPNIYFHALFGKVLFCLLDLFVAFILDVTFKEIFKSHNTSNVLIGCCWLFNPFTMTISSRGNAESIQIVLVVLTLLFTIKKKLLLSAIFFGLSVHFKLYSIIYIIPLLLYITKQNSSLQSQSKLEQIKYAMGLLIDLNTICFGVVSLFTFVSIGLFMYTRFGFDFIENTYLFHFSRQDTQHNFSPYFYILLMAQRKQWLSVIKLAAFLPQLISVVLFGCKYYKQLPLACFLQTMAFVSFNKVCTSQYFIWYISLLPIAYPYVQIPLKNSVRMVAAWLIGQGIWLFFAYLLEFKKYDVIIYVWLASILLLLINVILMYQITQYADSAKDDEKNTVQKRNPLHKND